MTNDDIPVAARSDESKPAADARVVYRGAVLLLATTLASLLLGRGYGLDVTAPASGQEVRRTNGDWESVPFAVAATRSPQELQLAIDGAACARVVNYEVTETPDAVHITVWRRHRHPSCVPLSVIVRLDTPLGDRDVRDGGVIPLQ